MEQISQAAMDLFSKIDLKLQRKKSISPEMRVQATTLQAALLTFRRAFVDETAARFSAIASKKRRTQPKQPTAEVTE